MEDKTIQNHSIILDSRKKLNISGVKDVLSFDEETIVLDSVAGEITIKGEGLRIVSFNAQSADLSAEGYIHAVVYMSNAKKSQGFLSKLFK